MAISCFSSTLYEITMVIFPILFLKIELEANRIILIRKKIAFRLQRSAFSFQNVDVAQTCEVSDLKSAFLSSHLGFSRQAAKIFAKDSKAMSN